ncbi:MAG TPA: hypothetical protein VHW60_02570 [Caulobacteraceae bacterium]|jgi:hypothetical protein|nr:hypothetical protein [Caulobacteraceae bacterium]
MTRRLVLSTLASLAAAVGLASPTVGACSTDVNPLIGSWQLSGSTMQDGAVSCYSAMVFSRNAATFTSPSSEVIPGGAVLTYSVRYVSASMSLVDVLIPGGYKNYSFSDENHMYYDDGSYGRCIYERT